MADKDIFGREASEIAGVFAADAAKLTFAGIPHGLVIQQLTVNYQQMVTRLYEVGSNYSYFVGGRTAGQARVSRVLGPSPSVSAFFLIYGNLCSPRPLNISFCGGCATDDAAAQQAAAEIGATAVAPEQFAAGFQAGQAKGTLKLRYVVVTGMGFSTTAQDMVISENTDMMFASLNWDPNTTAGC